MSYCRWSSDNFRCDLYCFESESGFETYIAGSRWREWVHLFHFLTDKRVRIADGITIRIARSNLLGLPRRLTHKPLRLPLAGKYFIDATETEFFSRLRSLNALGYRVPAGLIAEANRSAEAATS